MEFNTHYDIASICGNGHVICKAITFEHHKNADFCKDCGEKAITECPKCDFAIQGAPHPTPAVRYRAQLHQQAAEDAFDTVCYRAPSYCRNCGEAYPWTATKIEAAINMFLEFGGLDKAQMATIKQDVTNVSKDIPGTELSAMKIKKIWDSTPVAIAREIIMEFSSRTAAKILKGE